MPKQEQSVINAVGSAWLKRADRLARRVNLAWWTDQLGLVLPIAAVASTACVLLLRAYEVNWLVIAACAFLPVVGACVFAWWKSRGKFINRSQALVRIESALSLDTSLSTASRGVGRWPALPKEETTILHWRWGRSFLPPIFSVLLVAAALLWPLPANLMAGNAGPPKPRNLQALERVMEQLKDQEMVDPEDLAALERELEKLGKDPDSLYKPSTLEAADHLARRTSEALSNLAQASASAGQALRGKPGAKQAGEDRAAQAEELEKAMKRMADGAMKANPKLRDKLKEAAKQAMKELDPEAAKDLEKMLKENQKKFEDMLNDLGEMPMPGEGEPGEPGQGDQPGDQPAPGEEGDGNPLGRGGDEHGDAPPSPLSFSLEARKETDGGKLQPLAPNGDEALAGELLELRAVQPPAPEGEAKTEGAGTGAEAGGGSQIWRENLTPEEQRLLGKFYE